MPSRLHCETADGCLPAQQGSPTLHASFALESSGGACRSELTVSVCVRVYVCVSVAWEVPQGGIQQGRQSQ